MSIKAFYRQHVAFMESYSHYKDGEPVTTSTPPVWGKGNLQPWKQGIVTETVDAGVFFRDFKVLYVKHKPLFDLTGIPEKSTKLASYFYVDGVWYLYKAEQDWSTQAQGVKHWKVLGVKNSSNTNPFPDPIPVADLVQRLENQVNELEQLTPILREVLL